MHRYEMSGITLVIIGLIICVASAILGLKFVLFFIIGFFIFLNGVRKFVLRQKKGAKKAVQHHYSHVSVKYCTRCGFQLRRSDYYCPNCGTGN